MGNKPGSKRRRIREHYRAGRDLMRAKEMLLDAKWEGGHFVQRKVINGVQVHYYFDRNGNAIASNDLFMRHRR